MTASGEVSAENAFHEGDLERAYRLLAPLFHNGGLSSNGHHLLAIIERRRGRLEASNSIFVRALMLDPNNAKIHNDFANLLENLKQIEAAIVHYKNALLLDPSLIEVQINLGLAEARAGLWGEAKRTLELVTKRAPREGRAWHAFGSVLFELGEIEKATAATDKALLLSRKSARLLHLRAEIELARGGIAAPYYASARKAAPGELDICLGEAISWCECGGIESAISELIKLTALHPEWINGHAALAKLTWESGRPTSFAESYERALKIKPGNEDLWIAYVSTLMQAGLHAQVLDGVEKARRTLGRRLWFDQLEAAAVSEIGDHDRADVLYARLLQERGAGSQVAHVRHLLRTRRPEQAVKEAISLVEEQNIAGVWPYLSAAWRALDDPRWQWLEGDPNLISVIDLDISRSELQALTELLRSFHMNRIHPFDQTLRGGTQTAGSLLLKQAPEIVSLRQRFTEAIKRYVSSLPEVDLSHPFLRQKSEMFRITGSWSSRLRGEGIHLNHVHPSGWVSSAFYVSLPTTIGINELDPAGWLNFGVPPSQLDLDLQPIRSVQPKAGRLVLFPSLMWHGTNAFPAGERLTVAFDVVSQ
jgi:tetratricopeptide (TPR) repeat protein